MSEGDGLRGALARVVVALWKTVHGHSVWMSPEDARLRDEELEREMLSNWVLVESPAHAEAVQRGIAGIAAELRSIREARGAAAGESRRAFADTASALFAQLSPDDRALLATARLESADRSKVVADAAEMHSAEWLKQLSGIFGNDDGKDDETAKLFAEWASRFEESKYCKGVVGDMKSQAWVASHASESAGLTSRLLGEVAWSLFNSLHLSLRIALGRELADDETSQVVVCVMPCTESLLDLWLHTAQVSQASREREGRLGAVWREADALQERVIAEQRKAGDLPHFDPSPVIVREEEHASITLAQRQRLEEQLHFHVIDDYACHPQQQQKQQAPPADPPKPAPAEDPTEPTSTATSEAQLLPPPPPPPMPPPPPLVSSS